MTGTKQRAKSRSKQPLLTVRILGISRMDISTEHIGAKRPQNLQPPRDAEAVWPSLTSDPVTGLSGARVYTLLRQQDLSRFLHDATLTV
jgi:hypothetical protein